MMKASASILIGTLLLVATQISSVTYGAEVELRTPSGLPQFTLSANSNEDAKEVDALVRLAKALNRQGTDLNQFVSAASVLVPSPVRVTGVPKSNDLVAKSLPEFRPAQKRVFDHYVQMPIYRTVEAEVPGSDVGRAE